MGRFYKTSKPTFVKDNVYTPPFDLMAKVISNADKQIEKNETELLSLHKKLKADSLTADKPQLKKIINNYNNKIDELTNQLKENPLEFRRKTSDIKDLSRKIYDDWTTGEVAAIQSNKKAYDTWVKEEQKRINSKQILQNDLNFAKDYFLHNFGGTKYNTDGNYNNINLEGLNSYKDLEKIADDRAKGYVADQNSSLVMGSDGKYIRKYKTDKKYINPKEIQQGVFNALLNDQELMKYYEQQVKWGRMTGQEVNNMMQSAANRVANKYAYTQIEKDGTMKNDNNYGSGRSGSGSSKNKDDILAGVSINSTWQNEEKQKTWNDISFKALQELSNKTNENNNQGPLVSQIDRYGIITKGYVVNDKLIPEDEYKFMMEKKNSIDKYYTEQDISEGTYIEKIIEGMSKKYKDMLLQNDKKIQDEKTRNLVNKKINNYLSHLHNIEKEYNHGKGIGSWTRFAKLLPENEKNKPNVIRNMQKELEKYVKDHSMDNVTIMIDEVKKEKDPNNSHKWIIRKTGKKIKTTINELRNKHMIKKLESSVITNSFFPVVNDPKKPDSGQFVFKIKLDGPNIQKGKVFLDEGKSDIIVSLDQDTVVLTATVPFEELGLSYLRK